MDRSSLVKGREEMLGEPLKGVWREGLNWERRKRHGDRGRGRGRNVPGGLQQIVEVVCSQGGGEIGHLFHTRARTAVLPPANSLLRCA